MRNQHTTLVGRIRPLLLGGLLVMSAAACGGKAAPAVADANDPAATAAADTTTGGSTDTTGSTGGAAASTGPSITTVEVDKEAWFAGFHVTFGTATLETTSRRGKVTIEAMFENTGEDSGRLDATIALVSAGETAFEGLMMNIPGVQGLGKSKGQFAFVVEKSFSFDDAVLTLGLPTNQQAIVPLKGGADQAVSLEPSTLTLSGSATAGDLKLDVTSGEIRADTPWKHGQQKRGSLVLTIGYNATFNSEFAGGFAFTGENVSLKLPDGSIAGAIDDGQSQSVELIRAHATKKDLLSRFEIEDPADGTYTLIVRDGDATGEIAFTID